MNNLIELSPGQDNPNLPVGLTIGLDAFNIVPGAAFMLIDQPDPRVWVAMRVTRDNGGLGPDERVYVWARDASHDDDGPITTHQRAFDFDYCTKVALIGIVVNHDDEDDNNWGNS